MFQSAIIAETIARTILFFSTRKLSAVKDASLFMSFWKIAGFALIMNWTAIRALRLKAKTSMAAMPFWTTTMLPDNYWIMPAIRFAKPLSRFLPFIAVPVFGYWKICTNCARG